MISRNLKNISILDPPGTVTLAAKMFISNDLTLEDYEKEMKRQLAMKILNQLESEELIEYQSMINPLQERIEMHARIKVVSPYPTLNIMI
jgi:carbamoylphosphate synthase large subunit